MIPLRFSSSALERNISAIPVLLQAILPRLMSGRTEQWGSRCSPLRTTKLKLKDELASDLNVTAPVEERRNVARFDLGLATGNKQVGVVQGVVGFEANLYSLTLADREVLVNRGVYIPEPRTPERIPFGHVRWELRELGA